MKSWRDIPVVAKVFKLDFRGMDLKDVYFEGHGASSLLDLSGANFSGCDLSHVVFKYCDLREVDFSGAKLNGCKFYSCVVDMIEYQIHGLNAVFDYYAPKVLADNNLHGEYAKDYIHYNLWNVTDITIPIDTTGINLIGYKALRNSNGEYVIAKLEIPADAERIIIKGKECRCSKAKVLKIYKGKNVYNEARAFIYDRYCGMKYTVDKVVYADKFDERVFVDYTNGIHFYLTEIEVLDIIQEYENLKNDYNITITESKEGMILCT